MMCLTKEEYPDECIRGVSNANDIINGEFAGPGLFQFKENTDQPRADGDSYSEVSVTWHDNDDAFGIVFNQRKEGSGNIQFKPGVVILSTQKLEETRTMPQFKKHFSYERKPTDTNQYHGNLLLKQGMDSALKKMLASAIALNCFVKFVKRDDSGFADKVEDE